MELGKPDAGKPPVRFDEGREPGGHWVQILSFRRLLPTLHSYGADYAELCASSSAKGVTPFDFV